MGLLAWIPLLLLLGLTEASAARWVGIAEGAARAIYLDTEGVQHEGATVRAWMREVYTEEQRSPHTGVLYYSANSRMSFDCAKRTTVPLTRVFFGGDGTELRRVSLDAVELPALVSPGSLQEQLLDRACRLAEDANAPLKNLASSKNLAAAKQLAQKKPADGPTKVALADTKPRTDAPVGADAQNVPASDAAKPASAEPAKSVPAGFTPAASKLTPAPKPAAEAVKRPAVDSAKATVPQTVGPRFVGRKPAVPAALRAYVRSPSKLALAKPGKQVPEDAVQAAQSESIHWGYDGKAAPQNWGELKPEFAACGEGKRQSPIDIRDGARLDLEPIKFDYKPSMLRIIDNGHTVQVNYAEGSSITVSGVRYDLKQFHFHKPSEERVDGKIYDMVAHVVHLSADGRLAVVAVLMEAGLPNPFIASLWPHLPLEPGREISLPEVVVDINNLLPESRNYYAYMGSLTTPPCTEGVLWLVMKNPVSVASEQVGIFGKIYSINARPVQPANGRLIKESL
jgi:carbonic anhydrase